LSAKPITTVAAGALLALTLSVGAGPSLAAPLPLVLLFPQDQNASSDAKALVSLRTRLRHDGDLEVLSFDPDAPVLILAASDAKHPEWLSASLTGDPERLDIARAAGAGYAVVVADAGRGKVTFRLLEAGPAARTWNYPAESTSDAVKVIERDILTPGPGLGEVNGPVPNSGGVRSTQAPLVIPNNPNVPVTIPAPVAPLPSAPAPVAPLPSAPIALPDDNTPVATAPTNPNLDRTAADLASVQPTINTADRDVQSGDYVDAYALYRQAINLAPLSDVPRLKLAQAYLKGGQPDLALSAAQDALEVVPDSPAIQAFLSQYDKQNNTQVGEITRDQARVIKDPQDPAVHLELGDAFWRQEQNTDAETQFTQARDLAPVNSLLHEKAIAHLAGVHASIAQYDKALAEMQASGDLGYPLVLTVVQSDMDKLAGDMDQAQGDYNTAKITRADLYGKIQSDENQAQALSDFVAKIIPPAAYAHSHLDRVQAVTLFAQAIAVLSNYLETNDQAQHAKAVQLERDAQTEMLTAHAAEQKLGLWNVETRLGENSR
jgi:tetratricopeptide (TPR) repeat protein